MCPNTFTIFFELTLYCICVRHELQNLDSQPLLSAEVS